MSLLISAQGPPLSSAQTYLRKLAPSSSSPAPQESTLLESIRTALRGKDTEHVSRIHSSFSVLSSDHKAANATEEELTWDARTVILSCGGVMKKKWCFADERQPVQWACLGVIEQAGAVSSATKNAMHLAANNEAGDNDEVTKAACAAAQPSASRPTTLGPFARDSANKMDGSIGKKIPAVFVFLRSIGRIFLSNGVDFTFSQPFIVRRAWPLHPHGVLIQRVVEDYEYEEAELTEEPVLPSIFSLTSPFSEAAAVGLTDGIMGGLEDASPVSLVDEEENSTRPLRAIPAAETILWASNRNGVADRDNGEEIIVTLNTKECMLTIWRYAYVKPQDTPTTSTMPPESSHTPPADATTSMYASTDATASPTQLRHRKHPSSISKAFELPPLSALPNMAPSLSTTTTMASLVPEEPSNQPALPSKQATTKGRRDSVVRNELSMTMNRMALGARSEPAYPVPPPPDIARMKAAYWMQKLYSQQISEIDLENSRQATFALFDRRWTSSSDTARMAICLPGTQSLYIFALACTPQSLSMTLTHTLKALSMASVQATRPNVSDLLCVKADSTLTLLTHGLHEIPVTIDDDGIPSTGPAENSRSAVSLHDAVASSVTLLYKDGHRTRITLDLSPSDALTANALQLLALTLPEEVFFSLHGNFLLLWSPHGFAKNSDLEFKCFRTALFNILDLDNHPNTDSASSQPPLTAEQRWHRMLKAPCSVRFNEDPALRNISKPSPPAPKRVHFKSHQQKPNSFLAPVLYALHALLEDMRLQVDKYDSVRTLAPIACRIAMIVRPEWADYWNRLCPGSAEAWATPAMTSTNLLDDRIPVWPHDIWAILYSRMNFPDWKIPWPDAYQIASVFDITASYAYGRLDPLVTLRQVKSFYCALIEGTTSERAENVIQTIVGSPIGAEFLSRLPMGIAAPLREAARTCQLAPPGDWSAEAYSAIGRNDLAASRAEGARTLLHDGYRTRKQFIDSTHRKTIGELVGKARTVGADDLEHITGVELDLQEFTDIRFGQDRRLEEVARMLCSSTITLIRAPERHDLSEHEQTKEQQTQVVRLAERTLALPYGRAMFTYGSIPTVTREAYIIPKLEYGIRSLPLNITTTPESGKIPAESTSWGEFHNGVAAALRISPTAKGVEGSWIAFNKPADFTPEHAGFLYGLGLTGHLKQMLPWNTFEYLTPKHDLTSIGVLLGLATANVGSGHRHVTKLLAVHTPALLPTPDVDLNVPLVTQTAGLAGMGILYMGTQNRRMAEVALGQINRKDLVQPDISNEHREAYTYAAALAFGMIMLGTGSSVPADTSLVSRLNVLVHGDASLLLGKTRPIFDINLTSPAATMALGLMYLRTERHDIADLLTIPDTVIALNRIQPSFLLYRTLARSLIMWDSISPTKSWVLAQLPEAISQAMEDRFGRAKSIDDAFELAYYNIIAACCFAVGLKYAGTARQEAYVMIVSYFDVFSHVVYATGPQFPHRIKRAAVRDGLNLISNALCMVMAGTGEITCLRRLRHAYGMYHQAYRYGIHVATHMSIGLLFLGGGRFTLGTSNAAVAAMIAAFFPRSHQLSSDNKSYLQALRHLWVLAVEPRCLIARDVDTSAVVYLPVKITVKENEQVGLTQLISPTLIPDLDKLMSIRVDTPRYWPFFLNIADVSKHKELLLRGQTLFVKRRTAFLSYTEDPRGSRSLFVRSISSAGDAVILDFPQATSTKTHPAGDLSEFITSFSNDIIFLSFADHFCRQDEDNLTEERIFQKYCYASLLDSILQDKPMTLQLHLLLYQYRKMNPQSRYFNLKLQDLRFASDFYSRVYDRRFSGRVENNPRPSLIRHTTVSGVVHSLDEQLDITRRHPEFLKALGQYVNGQVVTCSKEMSQYLAWYLLRNSVPTSAPLSILKGLAMDAHAQCMAAPPPDGTADVRALQQGIQEVVHAAGTRMASSWGSGWTRSSLKDIISAWNSVPPP